MLGLAICSADIDTAVSPWLSSGVAIAVTSKLGATCGRLLRAVLYLPLPLNTIFHPLTDIVAFYLRGDS
jgi:hypothetical protein